MAGVLMQALDTTIANVALLYMQGQPVGLARPDYLGAHILHHRGRNHDRAGGLDGGPFRQEEFSHHMFVAGFTIASMACGAAQSLDQMVAFRLIWAVSAPRLARSPRQLVMLDIRIRPPSAAA